MNATQLSPVHKKLSTELAQAVLTKSRASCLGAPSKRLEFYGVARKIQTLRDQHEIIVWGPADTGKTLACLYLLNQLCWEFPGAQMAIVRKTYRSMPGSVLETFENKILPYPPSDSRCPVVAYGGRQPSRYIYPNRSVIWLGGMDNPDRVLSSERDVIYVNQPEEVSLTDWETMISRVTGRAGNLPFSMIIGDPNPAHPNHWIRTRAANDGPLLLLESKHVDNPALYDQETGLITEQGEIRLGILRNLTGNRLQRLYHGLWVLPPGAIYEIFEGEYGKHKVRAFSPNRYWPRIVAVDPYGAHIAALWMAYDPEAGVLNVYREYREPFGVTTPKHVENIIEMTEGETIAAWVGGGPSERQARVDFAGAGIPLIAPPITDVWSGIDRVIQLLKDFQLVIHDSCPNLLSEIGDYRRKLRDGAGTDVIVNKDAYDMLDCLRYGCAFLLHPIETGEQIVYNPVMIGSY